MNISAKFSAKYSNITMANCYLLISTRQNHPQASAFLDTCAKPSYLMLVISSHGE